MGSIFPGIFLKGGFCRREDPVAVLFFFIRRAFQPNGDHGLVRLENLGCISAHVGEIAFANRYHGAYRRTDYVVSRSGVAAVTPGFDPEEQAVTRIKTNLCHLFRCLAVDLVDLDLGVGLTMALTSSVVLLRIILEDENFLCLGVLDNRSFDNCAVNVGSANNNAFIIGDDGDLVELDVLADLCAELLQENDIALLNLVLLSAGFEYSVHSFYFPLSCQLTCLF